MSNENKGACHACEPMGELNKKQAAEIARLERLYQTASDESLEFEKQNITQAARIKELEKAGEVLILSNGELNRRVKELEEWKAETLFYTQSVGNNKEKWQLKVEELQASLAISIAKECKCENNTEVNMDMCKRNLILMEAVEFYNGEGFEHSFKAVASETLKKIKALDK